MGKRSLYDLTTIRNFLSLPIDKFDNSDDTYIAEIAGKDSIAAVLEATQKFNINNLLGIGIFHRMLYGNWKEPIENFDFIKKNKEILGIKNTYFIYLDIKTLFDQLIMRNMAIVQKYFQYWSPCPPCHLLFHMIRIPIAKNYKITNFITGERKAHDEKIKINQTSKILSLYKDILEKEGINLIQPLKDISNDQEILNKLGSNWNAPESFKCSCSSNYYDEDGIIPFEYENIKDSIEKFYYPLFSIILHQIILIKDIPKKEWIEQHIKKIIAKF